MGTDVQSLDGQAAMQSRQPEADRVRCKVNLSAQTLQHRAVNVAQVGSG